MIYLILTIICFVLCMFLVNQEQQFRKNIFNRNISNSNKIRFVKLKEFLNQCSDDDIKDLITFLFLELNHRKLKGGQENESKK